MSEKNNQIFREKSLKRVSSPEDLDKYIKTTTPSLWLLLASIIVLLVGVIAWATFGKIEVSSQIGINVVNGNAVSYITETDYEKINDKSYVNVDDKEYAIASIEGPFELDDAAYAYLAHAANIEDGGWYYIAKYKTDLANGDYKAKIVFETISPITFIIN